MRTRAIEKQSWEVLAALLTPANRLVVEIMLRTGLRVSDVLGIRTAQLKQRFTVTESKTGKSKQVSLSKSLLERLRAQAGSVWLFEGQRDTSKHRTRQAVWSDIKRAAKAMRLTGVVAPHSARKSVAVDEYRKSGSVDVVRQKLNHDRIDTTLLYLLSELTKASGGV